MLNNLVNIINAPTRVTNTSQTLLDPIVLSETIKVLDFGIVSVPADISDHSATYVFFHLVIIILQLLSGLSGNIKKVTSVSLIG